MIDRFEHFALATNEINRFIKKLTTEEMEKHGLKSSHALYFSLLSSNPKGLTATQLCEYSGRDKADVSRMLHMLEKNGLVTKEGSHQNLYNGVFRLTDEGQHIADHVKQRIAAAVAIAGRDLTPEQRELFYSALDSIVTNLRELSKKGIPEL